MQKTEIGRQDIYMGNLPLSLTTTGLILHVNNSSILGLNASGGSDSNDGTAERPYATLNKALAMCVPGRGDIILVGPGHSERITTASEINIDVSDVSIIGLGRDSKKGKIIYDNAAASTVISADRVMLKNLRFTASVTSVVVGLDISASVVGVELHNVDFDVDAEGTDEFLISVQTNAATNRLVIDDCRIDMGIAGAVHGIKFTGATDRTVLRNNTIRGDFSTACIGGITALSTNLDIDNNLLENGVGGNLNSEPAIELFTGTTGVIRNNLITCNLSTKSASIVASACLLFNNYYNEDVSSAATGGLIGTPSTDD